MNKLKIVFCLILCVVLHGNYNIVAAQTVGADKILVAGKAPLKQSDVDQLVEFYEWQIFKTATGKATLSGDRLTVEWAPARISRDDSCSPSKNYKKTLPAETETFQIFFETYFDDKQLCLAGTDKMCFSLDK